MALKCGIVGLPNVGKSTLFNCLSKAKAQSANFPFCTIEPNLGTITVPDNRLNDLEKLVNPEKVIPTTIEIVDIAGLVKGAHKGEGLGNQFLANIREVDSIIHVIRCFDDDNVIHVDGKVDPVSDKEIIDLELQLKDLETLEKRITSSERKAKTGDKEASRVYNLYVEARDHLLKGKSIRSLDLEESSLKILDELQLITAKPVIYVCNVDENSVNKGNNHVDMIKNLISDENAEILILGAAIEADIAELTDFEERKMFLDDLELDEPGVSKLIKKAYSLLNLQTYFTAGEKEVRAWTIKKGMTAPQAAGVIHTDFEKGFIKAEVIKFEDFLKYKSEIAVKEAGKLMIQGKEYILSDGDVMHFRFNV
jgi:GTP-binding protein YchF